MADAAADAAADAETTRRQAMVPDGVAWNARVAAARRMTTVFASRSTWRWRS